MNEIENMKKSHNENDCLWLFNLVSYQYATYVKVYHEHIHFDRISKVLTFLNISIQYTSKTFNTSALINWLKNLI